MLFLHCIRSHAAITCDIMEAIALKQSKQTKAKKNKHENNNKDLTKQLGNKDPSSTLIMKH